MPERANADPPRTDGEQAARRRLELSLGALASAAFDPARAMLSPSPPLLESVNLGVRPARLADVASGWFAFWMRELDRPVAPSAHAWRSAAALQALHEAGALKPDSRVACTADALEGALAGYLGNLGVIIEPPGSDSATASLWISETLPEQAMSAADVVPGGAAIHVFDYAFHDSSVEGEAGESAIERLAADLRDGGWRVNAADFSLGDHPLDGFVAADDCGPPAGGPTLRFQSGGRLMTPYVLVARSPS